MEMDREILFKAKRKDNGKWVEGYYIYCRKRHYILPVVNTAVGFDEREDEWDGEYFEVCGNIFDNPELLEVV